MTTTMATMRAAGGPGGRGPVAVGLTVALALAALVAPATPSAADQAAGDHPHTVRRGDQISVFSGAVEVPAGERLRGSVIAIGADVVIRGEVTQDVVVVLGELRVEGGRIGGAVTGVLAEQRLRDAEVGRELTNVLGSLELRDSTVARDLINILGPLDADELSQAAGELVNVSFGTWFPGLWSLLVWLRLLHRLLVFVLLILLAALIPERLRRIGEQAAVRYVPAFFVGLLGYLGLLVALVLLSVTVIGLPLAWIAFFVMKWIGIAAVFLAVGSRIGRAFGREMSLLGAILLTFGVWLVVSLLPLPLGPPGLLLWCALKTAFFLLVELPAVGLVILCRFGAPPRTAPATPAAPGP